MDNQIIQPTFCLNQPVEEIIPQAIGFNKDELINAVEEMCSSYDNIVYTADNISNLKADIAKLRKLDKILNDHRISIVKVYMQPAENFKAQVDEVRAIIAKRIDYAVAIDREFEEQRLTRKKAVIADIYTANIGDYADLVPLDKIFDPKWLNKGASEKSITAEIKKIVENIGEALKTIETLHSPFEERLKVYYFRTLDLGSALRENERLKEEQARVEEIKRKQLEREAATKAQQSAVAAQPIVEQQSIEESAPQPQAEAVENQESKIKVTLELELTTAQARALVEYFNKNNLTYKRVK